MTTEKIKDRARKLHAMANDKGVTEAEAQAFATALADLLARNNMSMSDVEWQKEMKTGCEKGWSRQSLQRIPTWAIMLASVIAEANQCERLIRGGYTFIFIGTAEAVEACVTTMEYLYNTAANLAQREYDRKYNALYDKGLPTGEMKGYKSGFLMGFITRLRQRYEELAAARAAEFASHSTSLMRINQSLQVAKDYMAEHYPKLSKSTRQQPKMHGAGYRDGVAQANKMNIGGAQVSSGSRNQNLLK